MSRQRATKGFGSVRKKVKTRKDGSKYSYWECRRTVGVDPKTGRQKQVSGSASTQSEAIAIAEQKAEEWRRQIAADPPGDTAKITVEQYLDNWLAMFHAQNVTPNVLYEDTESLKRYIYPRIGGICLSQLRASDIQQIYNSLSKGDPPCKKPLSPKTIKNLHGVIHNALDSAVKQGYLPANPSDACTLPSKKHQRNNYLTNDTGASEEDFDTTEFLSKFFPLIQGHRHEFLFQLALYTGMRQGELLGLRWSDVDYETETLHVRHQAYRNRVTKGQSLEQPKTPSSKRDLALTPATADILTKQRAVVSMMRASAKDNWVDNDLVFPNDSGNFLSRQTVYDCLRRICLKMGYEKSPSFHALRHPYVKTATTYFLRQFKEIFCFVSIAVNP